MLGTEHLSYDIPEKGTEMSIADIADAVGYDNLSYFYRIFQSAYGTTPKHFRDCK